MPTLPLISSFENIGPNGSAMISRPGLPLPRSDCQAQLPTLPLPGCRRKSVFMRVSCRSLAMHYWARRGSSLWGRTRARLRCWRQYSCLSACHRLTNDRGVRCNSRHCRPAVLSRKLPSAWLHRQFPVAADLDGIYDRHFAVDPRRPDWAASPGSRSRATVCSGPLFEIAAKAGLIHWPSLALGIGLVHHCSGLLGAWLPAVPGPLVAVGLATALSALLIFRD